MRSIGETVKTSYRFLRVYEYACLNNGVKLNVTFKCVHSSEVLNRNIMTILIKNKEFMYISSRYKTMRTYGN